MWNGHYITKCDGSCNNIHEEDLYHSMCVEVNYIQHGHIYASLRLTTNCQQP